MHQMSAEEEFRKVLESFYLTATKTHSTKYTLKNRLKKFMQHLLVMSQGTPESQSLRLSPKLTASSRVEKEPMKEFVSVQLGATRRSNNQLSVNQSRSRRSKSRTSSRDISDNQAKMFNCEWLYASETSSLTLLFGIMASLILTENRFAFKYLEDRVNGNLPQIDFSEVELVAISSNWQKIGDLLAQGKAVRWHKFLKEAVDRFPPAFAALTCTTLLGTELTEPNSKDLISEQVLSQLAEELNVTFSFFQLNYRQIEELVKVGSGREILMGGIRHSGQWVISNRVPEYSKEELQLRAIKASFSSMVSELVESCHSSSRGYLGFKELAVSTKEKEGVARDHFRTKLLELGAE